MRSAWFLLAVFLTLAATAEAQIGKNVSVEAGSSEDKALSDIYAATDPAQRIALLDKFMADFGKGDMALLAGQLYVSAYLANKNFDKVFEYGEKVLALDPEDFGAAVNMVHAAEESGNSARLFENGERVGAILARYKASAPPAGADPTQWQQRQAETLQNVQPDVNYVAYAMFTSAYKTPQPAQQAALLERFVKAFPDSPYTENAAAATAVAYQQAQNYPKMLEAAQRVLVANPNNAAMLLLLADSWSEKGQELEKAEADAKKALELLAQAKKPDQISDEQWQQQLALQKGMAYSALGQVHVNKNRNAQAVDAFKQADPLLKSNAYYYGRNLYRLGYTLAKMQRMPEARVVLTEAVEVNSPYRALAQQTLDKIGGAAKRTKR